jgi:hypothetical protein
MFPPEWAIFLGVLVALMGKLAARSDHRAARHRFALASSRLLGNLEIRLMSPLAGRTPQDQWRGPRAYSPNEPREFLMGRTCGDGVIRPPRGGAPSCGTKHLRSVSAKQLGYQTSSADGSCELAGAPPRCGMASLAGLSSHRRPCTRCRHMAPPIVQIGASPKGVACPAPLRSTPQSGTQWTWPFHDFHRIAQGHHRDASCLDGVMGPASRREAKAAVSR